MGQGAARGTDHGVEFQGEVPGLRQGLLGREHVPERAERGMGGGEVDHVGPAAFLRKRLGKQVQRRVRRGLVLADREGMQLRAEKPVEQHIAR